MYRPQILNRVPDGSVNVGWVQSFQPTTRSMLRTLTYHSTKPDNVLPVLSGDILVEIGSTPVRSDMPLLSDVSVLHPSVESAQPLYYEHQLGYVPDGTKTYRVYSPQASAKPTNGEARLQLVQEARLVDQYGRTANNIHWDIELVAQYGDYWDIKVYVSRLPERGVTIGLRYYAYNQLTGELLPNHWEVLNPTSFATTGWLELQDNSTTTYPNDFTIVAPASPTKTTRAPGIGVFDTSGSAPAVVVASSTITVGAYVLTRGTKSISEVCSELNANVDTAKFTPLSPAAQEQLSNGTYTPTPGGEIIYQEAHIHARYDSKRVIELQTLPNYRAGRPWYPRIRDGKFAEEYLDTNTHVVYEYGIPEADSQDLTNSVGTRDYIDVSLEEPRRLSVRSLQVADYPIASTSSVKLWVSGEDRTSHWLRDVDLQNGVIYLNFDLPEVLEVRVDYRRNVDYYEYREIDLNPTRGFNPDISEKYVGIYMTPHKIRGHQMGAVHTGLPYYVDETGSTTIRHIVADNIQDIKDALDGASVRTFNVDAKPWLLGVVHVDHGKDVDNLAFRDTRSPGGGLKEDVDPHTYDEATMHNDIGRWDGIPFQDAGAVVVRYPVALLGDTTPSPVPPAPNDSLPVPPNGVLTEQDIEERATKYIDAGNLPIPEPDQTL